MLVTLAEVGVTFGPQTALHAVDLELAPSSSLALVGSNGSGKSTLLDVIAGLTQPTSGRRDVRSTSPRIAYVLQHSGSQTWLPLTAGEVVAMGRYASSLPGTKLSWLGPRRSRPDDHDAIRDAARSMGIEDVLDRPLHVLSGGQRQRVFVAQAIAQRPEVLLLDEPITGLDLPSQERILNLISAEVEGGTCVVMSTHHLDEARHCERVMLLATEVVALGDPDEVLVPGLLRSAFGERVLGDHRDHQHGDELLVLDTHGHDHDEPH